MIKNYLLFIIQFKNCHAELVEAGIAEIIIDTIDNMPSTSSG
jgi:hypothetical protein